MSIAESDKTGREPWQQRVITEYLELTARRDKLAEFINGPIFKASDIDFLEKLRLYHQLRAMNSYQVILAEHIGAFR
jgi:hypothetical protein